MPVLKRARGSPKAMEAWRQWMELQWSRREDERRRVAEGSDFDHIPLFQTWCRRFTATEAEVGDIQAALAGGDTRLLEITQAQGKRFRIEWAFGRVTRLFALCVSYNVKGDCAGFSPLQEAPEPPQPASVATPPAPEVARPSPPTVPPPEAHAAHAAAEPADDQRFHKIQVTGRIHLGKRYELEQRPRQQTTRLEVTDVSGPAIDIEGVRPEARGLVGDAMEFAFADAPSGDLWIEGNGLVTSFGIFGAPGCGKTVLLMYLLTQVLEHEPDDPRRRYGALILDPKAGLIEDVARIVDEAGRRDDLVVVNTNHMERLGQAINVIDCCLDPYELGAILVLAGRSAGIDASDPFWFQEWTNLFAASVSLLRVHASLDRLRKERPVTLGRLIDVLLTHSDDGAAGQHPVREIQRIAREVAEAAVDFDPKLQRDVLVDVSQIERFYRQDYAGTIEAFITRAFGMFRRSRLACYSNDAPRRAGQVPFYEDIIENGKIVLVSVSPAEPMLAKTLCTLIKCLFQRTVLARGDLLAGTLTNRERPVVLACDEYSEVASEVPGQSMGDGQFLALARQYGCMALLATQSVNVLQASSLKETWRSVFSNFAAKIYMRLADNETAEEATKLAGESDWKLVSQGKQIGRGGGGASMQKELRERKNLPSTVLTQVLKTGEAVVIGSGDGGATNPGTFFMRVPRPGAPR